jgi:hypothetical protein
MVDAPCGVGVSETWVRKVSLLLEVVSSLGEQETAKAGRGGCAIRQSTGQLWKAQIEPNR